MIVVDLGCAPHEGERSAETLLERYSPDMLYGFDPSLATPGNRYPVSGASVVWLDTVGGVQCQFSNIAAWTHGGKVAIGYGGPNGLYDTIVPDYNAHDVWSKEGRANCFDFAEWLLDHPSPTVVKMNIEGAEYALMEHILDHGADLHVREWLIQWHDEHMAPGYAERREAILARVTQPVHPWTIDDITLCA